MRNIAKNLGDVFIGATALAICAALLAGSLKDSPSFFIAAILGAAGLFVSAWTAHLVTIRARRARERELHESAAYAQLVEDYRKAKRALREARKAGERVDLEEENSSHQPQELQPH